MAQEAGDQLAIVRQLRQQNQQLADENRDLKHGSGGGTSGPMDPSVPLKDYVDARDDAVESRLVEKLSDLPTAKEVRNNIWGAAATVLALALAAMAFGGDRFDAGIGLADARQAQEQRDAKQDAAVSRIETKIDRLIEKSGGAAKP